MDLLNKFYLEWFDNPDWWFSKNYMYDEYITQTYSVLLDIQCLPSNNPLQAILVYDQIPRHIYRNEYASHIIHYFLEKALCVVKEHLYSGYYNGLGPIEWTFFMLPLRHTKIPENIYQVLKEIWKKIENDKENTQIYKRFLKATYNKFLEENDNQTQLIERISADNDVCDYNVDFKSILHYSPDKYLSLNDKLLKNISFDDTIIDKRQTIIISLSGGVDSMVCSLLVKKQFMNSNIIALHICYDNRDECDNEVLFLKHWCFHLSIPLYVRKIREIHRKPCMLYEMRDLYESYTRDVRYKCYKSITKDEVPQVIMGHNNSDMLENIMTNIAHKNKYDNLFGMSPICIQDHIKFLRPLLQTSKEDIIEFAHDHNIPYLPNSTPVWSQRGQIRNSIIPILGKWNKEFVPSLFNLSNTLSSLYNIMQNAVEQFISKGYFNDSKKVFKIEKVSVKEVINEEVFWKEVFVKLYNIHPSLKSLNNFKISLKQFILSFDKMKNNQTKKVMISKDYLFEVKKVDSVSVEIKVSSIK